MTPPVELPRVPVFEVIELPGIIGFMPPLLPGIIGFMPPLLPGIIGFTLPSKRIAISYVRNNSKEVIIWRYFVKARGLIHDFK